MVVNRRFFTGSWNRCGGDMPAGPAYINAFRPFRRGEHLGQAVLRPISGAGMNFAGWSLFGFKVQPEHGTNPHGVGSVAFQAYSQPRGGSGIVKKFDWSSIYRD